MYSLSEIFSTLALTVLVYMTAWFVLAFILKRRDVVDSAWGLGFVLTSWTAYMLRNNEETVSLISALLVTAWGTRLFIHLTARNIKKSEDYRYKQMGELGSAKIWLKTFFSVFVLQGILLLSISLPIIGIMYGEHMQWPHLAQLGLLLWIFGIVFESVADYQLRRFIQSKKKGILQSGLWKYSRHPNYFGEVTVWWGAGIVSVAFGQSWGLLGALVIAFLILKISGIPLLEKRYAENAEYQKYARRTSIFFPLPVRKRES